MISPKKIQPFYKVIDITRNFVIILIFSFVVFSGATQIFLRYVPFLHSFKWTDEILRYLNIWLIFLGSGVAVKKGAHLNVDFFLQKFLPSKKFLLFKKITLIVIISFLILITIISTQKVIRSINVVIQAAPISIALFYLAVPVGCILMLVDYFFILIYGEHPFSSKNRIGGK